MLKKTKKVLMLSIIFAVTFSAFAQEAKTADELKAEREQLKTELKSKDVVKREDKIAKLAATPPNQSSVQSVDGLAATATSVLVTVVSTNDFLSTFKTELTDNSNGEVDITSHKAKLNDYVELAAKLVQAGVLAAQGAEQLKSAQDDVKGLSPTQALPASKSVKYSTEALKLSGEELVLQTKLITNLINSIKAAGNL
jgi:hypothetical protein